MPRELSQLLLDEGVVSPAGMLRALTRQREAGGTLDTALLELGLVAEAPLVAALARAADLPAAPLSAYERVDLRARRVFPSKVAERHGLAPFALEGRELSLVAIEPVDLGLLDEVSFMLSLHLAPHVGPEWRVRSLIQRLYGGTLAPRLERLAEQSASRGTSPGVVAAAPEPWVVGGAGRGEAPAEAAAPAPPEPPRPPASMGFRRELGEPLEPLSAALSEALEAIEIEESEPAPAPPAVETIVLEPPAPAPPVSPVALEPPVVLDRSAPPGWSLAQARAELARAATRDEVVVTLLRYARDFFEFAAIFAVTRDAVAGHDGLGPDGDARELVRAVAIYASDPGIFRTTIETTAPYLGRVDLKAAGNQVVLGELARGTPRTVLVAPILLHHRPVCLLYADNGPAPVSARRLGDLLLVCATVGAAFERIIKARKEERPRTGGAPPAQPAPEGAPDQLSDAEARFLEAGGRLELDELYASAPPSPAVTPPEPEPPGGPEPAPQVAGEVPAELLPEVSAEYALPEAGASPGPEPLPPEPPLEVEAAPEAQTPPEAEPPGVEPSPAGPPPAEVAVADLADDPTWLVGAYLTAAPGSAARASLLARLAGLPAAAPILCELLPGTLEVAPEALARTPVAAQGPVLEALAAIGQPAVPQLLALLGDAQPARRRVAVALLGAIGDPATLVPLSDRCLDADPAVAEAAREALAGQRGTPAMRPVPERLRRALASGLPARACAAARALQALRDAESIPGLIQALDGGDPATATAAAEALSTITLQRHGRDAHLWLAWWKQNRGRGRAEWLFGGLTAEDQEVRATAAAELARVAPPPVRYAADMTPAEREPAARAWAGWFTRSGYRI